MNGAELPPVQTVVHWFDDPEEPGFYTSVNETEPQRTFPATHWKPLDGPGDVAALLDLLRAFANGFFDRPELPDDTILEVARFNVLPHQRQAYPGLRLGDFRKARAALAKADPSR